MSGRGGRVRRGNSTASQSDASPLRTFSSSPSPSTSATDATPTQSRRPYQKKPQNKPPRASPPAAPSSPSAKPPSSPNPNSNPNFKPPSPADSPQKPPRRKPRPRPAAASESPRAPQRPSPGSPAPPKEQARGRRKKQRKPRKPRAHRRQGGAGNVSPNPPASLKLQLSGLPACADAAWLSGLLGEDGAAHAVYQHLHPSADENAQQPMHGGKRAPQAAFLGFDSAESMLACFSALQRDHPALTVSMAPYQALPRAPPLPLPLSGDIEEDPDFLQFRAILESPGQSPLATQTPAPNSNPSGMTPLLEDLNRRKAHHKRGNAAKQKGAASPSTSSATSSAAFQPVAGPKRRKRTRTRGQRRAQKKPLDL